MKKATLLVLSRPTVLGGDVLLHRQEQGPFVGLLMCPGGKLNTDETPVDCIIRETEEEARMRILRDRLRLSGNLFGYKNGQLEYSVSIFCTNYFESIEILPHTCSWHPVWSLPFCEMPASDRYWLPAVIAGLRLNATIRFAGEGYRERNLRSITIDPDCTT